MTIALVLLAAAGPCAVPTLCPTRKQLVSALMARAEGTIATIDAQSGPNDTIIRVPSRILGVSDMVCGEALPDAPQSIDCKYTVRYSGDISYEVATLAWRDGKWVITEAHGVWRKR